MIELQGRCKRMSEHGSDEWHLRLDPSLPGLPGLSIWEKKGISLPKQSFGRGFVLELPHWRPVHLLKHLLLPWRDLPWIRQILSGHGEEKNPPPRVLYCYSSVPQFEFPSWPIALLTSFLPYMSLP